MLFVALSNPNAPSISSYRVCLYNGKLQHEGRWMEGSQRLQQILGIPQCGESNSGLYRYLPGAGKSRDNLQNANNV